MQTAEQAIVERIKLSRGTTEPAPAAPTENAEAVNVSEDAPVEEVITEEAQANEEVTTDTEEPAEEVTAAQTNDEETDLFYYDIDGEEVSSTQLSEWKANGLMQADYTRKTQELADSRKDLEGELEAFKSKQSKFDNHIATLEAMINEEVLTPEALVELREYEPEEYIKYTEKMSSRTKFVSDNKSKPVEKVSFDVNEERQKLWGANPSWEKDGKQTKAFTADMKLIESYAKDNGFTDFSNFKAQDFQMMLNASKYLALNNKNAAIEKRVRLAPVTTKPRAKANNSLQSDIDVVQKRFNKTGDDKDFLLLRKLNRQLK